MSSVSSWLLSIACIVILSVLAEFVLPEGQINKYTRVIFSFIVLLVIISPLPKIFDKNFDLTKYFDSNTNIQENYLYQINLDKLNALNSTLNDKVKQKGLDNIEISINANIMSENLEIFSVCFNLKSLTFNDSFNENRSVENVKMILNKIVFSFDILKNVEVKFDE